MGKLNQIAGVCVCLLALVAVSMTLVSCTAPAGNTGSHVGSSYTDANGGCGSDAPLRCDTGFTYQGVEIYSCCPQGYSLGLVEDVGTIGVSACYKNYQEAEKACNQDNDTNDCRKSSYDCICKGVVTCEFQSLNPSQHNPLWKRLVPIPSAGRTGKPSALQAGSRINAH